MTDKQLIAYALAHTYATHEFADPADETRIYELLLAAGDEIGVEVPLGDEYQRAVLHALDPSRIPDFPLDGPNINALCRRCGSPLENERCPDETCPYSDHAQDAEWTEG
jgi:hypothetical protein